MKPAPLIKLCIERGVVIVIDNADELALVKRLALHLGRIACIALRVSGFTVGGSKLESRFGFDVDDIHMPNPLISMPVICSVSASSVHFVFLIVGMCSHRREERID